MRWPAAWRDPAALELLRKTPINCLVCDDSPDPSVASRARESGLEVLSAKALPGDVRLVKGEWPGVRGRRRQRGSDRFEAGPTGAPWIDSNGWRVRLEGTLRPGKAVWIDAAPPQGLIDPVEYVLAVADASAHGGRWVIALDPELAQGLSERQPAALQTWARLAGTLRFFAGHPEWAAYQPMGAVVVVSDFAGGNEFLSHEVLNLTARQHQPYRIVEKAKLASASLEGARAAVYPDAGAPPADVRKRLLRFAEEGGLVVAGPSWRDKPGELPAETHPRFWVRRVGKGRVAASKEEMTDPYLVASDAVVLLSHDADVVRFFNATACGSYATRSPDRVLIHVLNYATRQARWPLSMEVAGRYRAAKIWRPEETAAQPLKVAPSRVGVELHLPEVAVYAAVELTE